jgi:hypothetical protein
MTTHEAPVPNLLGFFADEDNEVMTPVLTKSAIF